MVAMRKGCSLVVQSRIPSNATAVSLDVSNQQHALPVSRGCLQCTNLAPFNSLEELVNALSSGVVLPMDAAILTASLY